MDSLDDLLQQRLAQLKLVPCLLRPLCIDLIFSKIQ